MRVAREGLPFIGGAWAIAAGLAAFHFLLPFVAWLPIAVWVVAFFRDPERDRVRGDDLVLAPADGRVVSIIAMDETTFIQGPTTRVSIFMNVFDVHVNRYPAAGSVRYRTYVSGKFLNAATEKSSLENEQATVGLETPRGRLLIRQIAGLIARRIATDHQVGAVVAQGQRLGLIRFGSRVDLFVPANATVTVGTGARTKAGETVVARWT